jgi:hypothetical protein
MTKIGSNGNQHQLATDKGMSRRSMLKAGAAAGAGLAFGSFYIPRASAAPAVLKFGSDSPITAPHTKSAVTLKEIVEEKTAGGPCDRHDISG